MLHSPTLGYLPKTSIIISNLAKDDFLAGNARASLVHAHKLSLADQIKLAVLTTQVDDRDDTNYVIDQVDHWSNLPFLQRIIIIFREETVASGIFKFLTVGEKSLMSQIPQVHIALQENLLLRSKSHEDVTSPTLPGAERGSLGDNLRAFRDAHANQQPRTQLPEHATSENATYMAPAPAPGLTPICTRPNTILRAQSQTRTLFSPLLTVNTSSMPNTGVKGGMMVPPSPTITLDESL